MNRNTGWRIKTKTEILFSYVFKVEISRNPATKLLDRKIRILKRGNSSRWEGNILEEVKGRGIDSSPETGSRRIRENLRISHAETKYRIISYRQLPVSM